VPRNPYITENTEDTEVFLSFLWVFSMFSMLILSVLGVFAGAGVLWAAWALIAFHFSPRSMTGRESAPVTASGCRGTEGRRGEKK
jgi:hypothetical protein